MENKRTGVCDNMKEEELRIGNIYMSINFNVPVYLEAEDIAQMVVEADGAEIEPINYVKPIKLTTEWVNNLGFKNWGDKYTWSIGSFIIHKRKRGWVLRKSTPIIKHVHQLQNLYFALTGEELAPFVVGAWKEVKNI